MTKVESIDLNSFALAPGEGKTGQFVVPIEPLSFGGQRYTVSSNLAPVELNLSRTVGGGFVLKLNFEVTLEGLCMRCLGAADVVAEVEVFEVNENDDDPDMSSPYVSAGVLDLAAWVRDALALSLNGQILCSEDCRGLCGECGVNLNTVTGEHTHERPIDARWQALDRLKFDDP